MKARFLTFLGSLIALFLLYPVMVELGRVRLFRLALMVVLATALYSLGRGNKRILAIALVLGVPALVAQSLAYQSAGQATAAAAGVTTLLFLGFVIVVMLTWVLGTGGATGDRIVGAISVFLLLGLLWTTAYGLLLLVDPESFRGLGRVDDSGSGQEYGLIYYSFVTLTTLGYGDITPISPMSRTLSWMEAVVGQLFLAILVARLVGLHVAGKHDQRLS